MNLASFPRRWAPQSFIMASSLTLSAFMFAGYARADAAGDKVLAAMDEAMNRAKTHFFEYEVITREPNKADRKMQMQVRVKGDKRLTEFLAPGEMQGIKVLYVAKDQHFAYFPSLHKVNRITDAATDADNFGMAFAQGDLIWQKYSPEYIAQVKSESATEIKLILTARSEVSPKYAKIEITVDKAKTLPLKLEYYSEKGAHLKTETRSNYNCIDNICTPGELEMVDHTKAGLTTKLTRKKWKINEEMSDDLFSKRMLLP